MATAIRMRRGGRTHAPYYRVVVVDSRRTGRGRVIDQIGVYQPCARPEPVVEIDGQKALAWLAKGAQPSDTVRSVLKKIGIWRTFVSGAMLETPAETAATAPPDTGERAEVTPEAEGDVETPLEEIQATEAEE